MEEQFNELISVVDNIETNTKNISDSLSVIENLSDQFVELSDVLSNIHDVLVDIRDNH